MEEQTTSSSACPASDSNSTRPDYSSRSRLESSSSVASSQTLASSATLRFPKPEGSRLLAHWVTSSSTGTIENMQASVVFDETSSLADSAYELISSTDGESQDGRGPDSLADSIAGSIDLFPRADDVVSLNGNETTYDYDDGDDDDAGDEQDDRASDDVNNSSRFRGFVRNTPNQSRMYSANHEAADGIDENAHRSNPADSIRYAEQALCNPSTQSLPTLEYDSSHGDISGSHELAQSIEFHEGDDIKVYQEKIEVKHTLREFSEAETAILAANMGITADAPERMAATIRQTMSSHCLSTRDPLRVLFTGSDAGYNEIMYKISSALLASAASSGENNDRDTERRHSSSAGIYNIMPISSFGSAKVPEIDEIQLMGVSDYYIKVERCVKASEMVVKGAGFPNDVMSTIELDSGQKYLSTFSASGSTVNPKWLLPHLAVFYVSGNDDEQAEATRSAAWEFMTLHGVPSIFISHTQTFSRSPQAGRWQNFVDQAAVHVCLESRDPAKQTPPERLPIDLVSFLNIDARQMNRNLAYLTGLHDTPQAEKKASRNGANAGDLLVSVGSVLNRLSRIFHLLSHGNDPRQEILQTAHEMGVLMESNIWRVLALTVITILLSSSVLLYIPAVFGANMQPSQRLAPVKSNSALLDPSMAVTTSLADQAVFAPITSTMTVCSVPSLNPTVTISFVTTKTVEILVPEPSQSQSQVHFGGFLTDRAHNARSTKLVSDTEIQSTGCSIQVYSSHEILVKVPSGTKTKWLAKGAIDIDVWKGQEILKSRLSTTDEGIIIEISKKDAFGVMNVSIVTTRRPKINETFAVDFGKPTASQVWEAKYGSLRDSVQAMIETGRKTASRVEKAASELASGYVLELPMSKDEIKGNASLWLQFAKSELEARLWSINTTKIKHAGATSFDKLTSEARSFLDYLPPADRVRDDVQISVLHAQIASKLWWLRVQGKTEEHDIYEKKAAAYVRDMERAAAAGTNGRKGNMKDVPEAKQKSSGGLTSWF